MYDDVSRLFESVKVVKGTPYAPCAAVLLAGCVPPPSAMCDPEVAVVLAVVVNDERAPSVVPELLSAIEQ